MIDLEQELTSYLQRRADAATPRYDLEGVEQGNRSVASLADDDRNPQRTMPRAILGLAAAAVLALVVAGAIAWRDNSKTGEVSTPAGPTGELCCYATRPEGDPVTGASAVLGDRWLAFAGGSKKADHFRGIYLVRDGDAPRRIELPGSGTNDDECPAFAPKTAAAASGVQRLMISRRAYGDHGAAELVILDVANDGSVSSPRTISLSNELGAVDGPVPCAIWSPDGNWAALGGGGEVWLVNTKSGAVHGLPGYYPTDLEWRPGTDELAFTGKRTYQGDPGFDTPVRIYSVSTGDIRTVGAARATNLTWSPDGRTLAFTGGKDQPGIRLVNADGTNPRQLTDAQHLGAALNGHGVVWSPDGRYIAYQRALDGCCIKGNQVVLVTATTDDAANPIGAETVIAPPRNTAALDGAWYPYDITWSPDATHIVYLAWSADSDGLIAVPLRDPRSALIITAKFHVSVGGQDGTPWVPLQQWSGPVR